MKQITSVIIQLSYVKGIDTQAERNKIISEVKFILTMGYSRCFTTGWNAHCLLFPLFLAEDL